MQAQDAAATYFFKSWEWVETNLRTVFIGVAVIVLAAILVSYYFWQQNETELAAGKALTQLFVSPPSGDATQLADAYFKIATDYSGTQAAGRALMLGATTLFYAGQYSQAQPEFQKYLRSYPGGVFSASATLGIAASLDAQGKTDQAADVYQRIINSFSDPNAVDAAKLALGRIDEQKGKLADAENFFQDVARDDPNSPLASEAALHAIQLRSKIPAATASNSPPSFNLNTQP